MKSREDIDSYIKAAPKGVRPVLEQMRAAIKKAAPQATETISYGIPTYRLNGNLVHFGGFKDHISFFPTSSGVAAFREELSKYKTAKGTIQFPFDKPLPLGLIKRIVAYRLKENMTRARKRKPWA